VTYHSIDVQIPGESNFGAVAARISARFQRDVHWSEALCILMNPVSPPSRAGRDQPGFSGSTYSSRPAPERQNKSLIYVAHSHESTGFGGWVVCRSSALRRATQLVASFSREGRPAARLQAEG